jgi:hypothetical protein
MKHLIAFFTSVIAATCALGNVSFIDISKISNESKYIDAFNFVKDNRHYYDTWRNEWNLDKPKEEFIKKLRDHYLLFSSIAIKNEELFLLLGDISHYLYNLDDTAYYNLAVGNFNAAIKSDPKDFRAYWFLGNHYALSSGPVQAIDNFKKAEKLLSAKQPAEFWNDYAWATAIANMPSHCIFAMDKVKSILHTKGSFETQVGESIHKRIVAVDKDSSYRKEDIWATSMDEKITFTSRALGIKLLVDTSWELNVYDYKNRQGIFLMTPPTIKSKKGTAIHYTIALIIKTADDRDKLDDFINMFVSKYPEKNKISFSARYDKMIAYEIKDKTMYQNMGGGHLYMLGIERNAPEYPGLLLETPVVFPDSNDEQIKYYEASSSKNRFKGKIFYAILLDTCEDIHEQSLRIFKTLFNDQMVIE